MRRLVPALILLLASAAPGQEPAKYRIDLYESEDLAKPVRVVVGAAPFSMKVSALDGDGEVLEGYSGDGVKVEGVGLVVSRRLLAAGQRIAKARETESQEERATARAGIAADLGTLVDGGRWVADAKAFGEAVGVRVGRVRELLEDGSDGALDEAETLLREAYEAAEAAEPFRIERTGDFENGTTVLHHVASVTDRPHDPARILQPAIAVAEGEARSVLPPSRAWAMPGWFSLVPSLLAIVLAIAFRQVLLALIAGVWAGATLVHGMGDPATSWLTGLMRFLDTYLVGAIADPSHAMILMFSLGLGGMVAVIARSGGMKGIVNLLAKLARGPRSGQFATWAMGMVIFFDDYANSLLVGNTMRPLSDRLRISREKLSYIVDSTAAPVASIALISTWIGFELGLINEQLVAIGATKSAYAYFLESIPYRFYALYAFFFVLAVAVMGRDFGPMLKAERRALGEGKVLRDGAQPLAGPELVDLEPVEGKKARAIHAIVPIAVVIAATLAGLFYSGAKDIPGKDEVEQIRTRLAEEAGLAPGTIERLTVAGDDEGPFSAGTKDRVVLAWNLVAGKEATGKARFVVLREIFAVADPFSTLMWAAFAGSLAAGLMAWVFRALSLTQVVESWVQGVKSMLMAALILILAWSIGAVCNDLGTARYVSGLATGLDPRLLPALGFLAAAAISFATGSSWATMTILFPILVPVTFMKAPGVEHLMLGSIGAVLAGSIFGDHCSPISDTTVMSSMASACDHSDHVRTQMPYAFLGGAVALVFGYLPAGYWDAAWLPWVLLAVGAIVQVLVLRFVGKKVDEGLEGLDESTRTMEYRPERWSRETS